MYRLIYALSGFLIVTISPASADAYIPSDASWLAKACLSNDANAFFMCEQFLTGVTDTYFVSFPNCPRPESAPFISALDSNVKGKLTALTQQGQTIAAASIVISALNEINPCASPTTANYELKAKNCGQLIAILNNQWTNNYVKQATLEAARNRGCLN